MNISLRMHMRKGYSKVKKIVTEIDKDFTDQMATAF